jgi:subtilisin family serine protease
VALCAPDVNAAPDTIRPLGSQNVDPVTPRFEAGELLVKFKTEATESARADSHARSGSVPIKDFKSLRIHHVKLKKDRSVYDSIAEYLADPNVEWAEPNYWIDSDLDPNDLFYVNDNLWNLRNIGQTGGTADADVNAPEAWDHETGSGSVVVAVIDSGIDYAHPDLADNMWVNTAEASGQPGVDDDGNGYVDDIHGIDTLGHDSDPIDDTGHGTHVAGIIGAVGNNGIGVVGVNWDVQLMACKFLGPYGGPTSAAIECLEYVRSMKDRGVDIVATNDSWGGNSFSQALYDAISDQQEILFFASAGNDSRDIDYLPHYPASFGLPNLVTVAATDHDDNKALFSSFGRSSVHLAAPGQTIISTYPLSRYMVSSGTSMATAHATGLAALLKAQDVSRDWIFIKNRILVGGRDLPGLDGISITGKRLDLNGSLSCVARPLFSVMPIPESPQVGTPVDISVLSLSCELPAGPVIATSSEAGSLGLLDDGMTPDVTANDGIFSGTWIPGSPTETLTLTSPSGTETIDLFLKIETAMLSEGQVGDDYDHGLKASGGTAPYTWSVASGSLPAGLSLDGATGVISGVPTTVGTSYFTVQVTDASLSSTTRDVSLRIVGSLLSIMWVSVVGTSESDYGYDAAIDSAGNTYITGSRGPGAATGGWQTVKLNPLGALEWMELYGTEGSSAGLDVDPNGDVYVAGTTPGSELDYLTLKYDSSGNLLWERIYKGKGKSAKWASDVAVDDSGDYYVTGLNKDHDWLTVKFDQAGNELWSATRDAGAYVGNPAPVEITVRDGFVYVAGAYSGDPEADFHLVKYDVDGNELWGRIYDTGRRDYVKDMAVDAEGNVYLLGDFRNCETQSSYCYDVLVLKYDASGTLLWDQLYNAGEYERADAIGVDKEGNVYVAGYQKDYCDSHFIIKYHPSGGMIWENWNEPSEAMTCRFSDITVNRDYSIHTTGYGYHATMPGVNLIARKYEQHGNLSFGIVTTSLRNGTVGVPYSETLEAVGGTEPYTWLVTSGSLPSGLALDEATGTIDGIPVLEGAYPFTVEVTDSTEAFVPGDLSIRIDGDPGQVSCSDYSEPATCEEDPLCIWEGGRKNGTCNEHAVCVPTAVDEAGACGDGADNDCDGVIDCDDTADCSSYPDCNIDCSSFTAKNSCNAQPVCSWSNKQKVCVNN